MGTKKPTLVERLRAARPTAKTEFLSRWPEIQEAIEAGFSYRAIHEELRADGLQISYQHFVDLANAQQAVGSARPVQTRPSRANRPARTTSQNEAPPRYEHNPHPDENDLI